MNEEILAKVRAAKSADELIEIAKENGRDITAEQAEVLFKSLSQNGELSYEELESAVGGCRTGNGERVVTAGLVCPAAGAWECETCHKPTGRCTCGRKHFILVSGNTTPHFNAQNVCGSCAHSVYTKGRLICTSEYANSVD